jgi:ElaB/YqjD/DUF883 family membrane-anchored ribosome-binding protein
MVTKTTATKAGTATKPAPKPRKPRATKARVVKPAPLNEESSLRDHASKIGKQAADKARDAAKQGIGKASDVLENVAATVEDSAKGIDERFGKPVGNYARKAADAVSGAASSVKGKEVDELLEAARGFVKKNPLVAAGAAAAIGFALTRLFRAGDDDASDA